MKKLFSLILTAAIAIPALNAVTFTGTDGKTYTYTVKQTQQLNSGVKHSRLRFTSPSNLNVQIVEVNVADPNVKIETTLGSDKMFSAQTLVNRYNNLKNAGRKPLVIQNASFWAMSSQKSIIDQGKYAANTALGGQLMNGQMVVETNSAFDTWVGGPEVHAVFGVKADKTAFVGKYKTNIRLMCPTRWGSNENTNILCPTEVNKYCHYGTLAVFTPMFPSDRAIQVIDARNGQGSSSVAMTSSDATYAWLKLKSGQSLKYNTWVEYEITKISRNCSSGTRGSSDLVVVFALGNHAAVNAIQVGDAMKMKYMWHPASQNDPASMTAIPGLEQLVAGNQQVMINGAIQTPDSYCSTVYSRSAYGVSQDEKKVIMCVIDKSTDATYGSSAGCNSTVMCNIMKQFGAYNVVNCDAGGSAQMVIGGKQVGTPSDSRGIVTSVVVFDEGSSSTGGEVEVPDIDPGDAATVVNPTSGTANPYAYDLRGNWNGSSLLFSYKLNAPCKSAKIIVYRDGEPVKEVQLQGLTKGEFSGGVPTTNFLPGTYTWAIEVEGTARTSIYEFASAKFWHPQTVQVVTDPNDDYFGTVITAEGQVPNSSNNSQYWSWGRGVQGIYLYTAGMDPIPNTKAGSGVYAFRGGLPSDRYLYKVSTKNGSVPRKIRISADGRIFMATQSSTASPVYEIPSIKELVENNANFTQVTGGDINKTDLYWTDNNGNFSSASVVGFDVTGSGKDLTFCILGGKKNLFDGYNQNAVTCNTYKLGNDKIWGGKVPTSTVAALNGRYLINYTSANIAYDNRGGLWFCQHRSSGSGSATQPCLVYIDKDGVERYKNTTLVCGGGGIAFNSDYTQLLVASTNGTTPTFSIYDIQYKTDGTPQIAERLKVVHGMGTYVNDYAFDVANNVYCVGNSGEYLKGFALPRTANTYATDAAAKYGFVIEQPEDPEPPVDPPTPPVEEPKLLEVGTPSAGNANPFAYEVSASYEGTDMTVNYRLNAPAKAINLVIYGNTEKSVTTIHKAMGKLLKSVSLGDSELTPGMHSVTVSLADLNSGEYMFALDVESPERNTVNIFASKKMYHGQGLETVRDETNPYYGHVLATEAMYTASNTYISGGEGTGIYVLDPNLNVVKNKVTGKGVNNGGLSWTRKAETVKYTTSSSSISDYGFRKIRISDDGRIFATTQAYDLAPLYELPSIETMLNEANATFTPVFDNITLNRDDYTFRLPDNTYVAAINVGFSVTGSGDNLKFAMLNAKARMLLSGSYNDGACFHEYNLGSNANWAQAPSNEIAALHNKWAITRTSCNLDYDNRGGIWFSQHRGSPTSALPSLKYVGPDGTIKYTDESTVVAGGAFRLSPDCSRVAIASAAKQFSVYDISYAADGTPTLTERIRVSHAGSGLNDFAWDNAGNLYAVSNNSEDLVGYALPRNMANGSVATTPGTNYSFSIVDGSLTSVELNPVDGNNPGSRWSAYGSVGTIHITGEAKSIEVFSTNGKLVGKNKRNFKVKKGVYIVRIDGGTAKVVVK